MKSKDENQKEIKPNSGEFILEQLQQMGSNIKQTHEFTFWLYFPEEDLAKLAGAKAEKAGFQVDISPPLEDFKDAQWLCLLYCPHIPDEELLDGISDFCYELAHEFGGKFDGWETRLELPEGVTPDNYIKTKGYKEINPDGLPDL